jgi:hypothetical protein
LPPVGYPASISVLNRTISSAASPSSQRRSSGLASHRQGALNRYVDGAGLLYAAAGMIAWFSGDSPAAIGLSRRALELAEDPSQALVEIWARVVETFACHHIDRQRARAVAEHRANAEFAHAAGLTAPESAALYAMAITSTQLDDQEAVERVGIEAGSVYALVSCVAQAFLHTLGGRPDTAERLLTRGGAALQE